MPTVKGIPWKHRGLIRRKYPNILPLSESQMDILNGLAREGPTNAYQLKNRTKKAYSFVLNSLKNFESRKIVVLKREEETEKGTKSKIYDLTLEGVLLILHGERSIMESKDGDFDFIHEILERYNFMAPLIFGKWKYFEQVGLGKLFFTRLKILLDTHNSNPFKRGTGFYPWLEMTQQLTRFFYLFDFYRLEDHFITDFDPKVWLNAVKKDEELKAYMIQELKYDQKNCNNMQIRIEKVMQFIESR